MAAAVSVRPVLDQRAKQWLAGLAIAAALAAVTAMTYAAGGTRTVLPHLFYVPIMLAAARFGFRGGIAAAIAATLLCGPVMPLEVAAGEPQVLAGWLSRGVFFLTIGSLAGGMLRSRGRSYERELTAEFQREMRLAETDPLRADPSVEQRIRAVLDEGLFHPVFQPVYSLPDGQLIGVEALSRFTSSPQQPPDVWFAEAASVGLGTELELAAITRAIADSAALPAGVALAVNCSPSTLTDPRFHQLVASHPRRCVTVEVTEHAVVDDYGHLARVLDQLRRSGVRLAVDDVGAGISSLRHIVRLAPDIIKLDISLTQHVNDDPIRRVLADCLIQFAHRTGSTLVAEGIEDEADLATWRELGASAVQGYLMGRPGPLPAPQQSQVIARRRAETRSPT
ncbi:MAG: EAL domain-containing protein [Nitriliruptor sp.]|uniref:EAL domain-containing protein n=1 Tax=Nitriliruptor sp. TaxID=2448056 RepID=UPI0034A0AB6D